MQPTTENYEGHEIQVRARPAESADSGSPADPELIIDDEPVPYGRLPDGQYYLHETAYEWSEDLLELARRLVDYRQRRGGE
jgi:hypothetical protein